MWQFFKKMYKNVIFFLKKLFKSLPHVNTHELKWKIVQKVLYKFWIWRMNNNWKFNNEKKSKVAHFSQIWPNFGRFRALFGPKWNIGRFCLFLGKVSTPDASKIFVGILSQISGEIRNFGQYGNTVYFLCFYFDWFLNLFWKINTRIVTR